MPWLSRWTGSRADSRASAASASASSWTASARPQTIRRVGAFALVHHADEDEEHGGPEHGPGVRRGLKAGAGGGGGGGQRPDGNGAADAERAAAAPGAVEAGDTAASDTLYRDEGLPPPAPAPERRADIGVDQDRRQEDKQAIGERHRRADFSTGPRRAPHGRWTGRGRPRRRRCRRRARHRRRRARGRPSRRRGRRRRPT